MVFGIPTDARPVWQPLTVHVVPSGINARLQPNADAPRVAGVSGEIGVSARNLDGTALYVPAVGGWVWAAPAYIDPGDISLESLPVRAVGEA